MGEQLLRIEEVALLVGVSTQTINIWYRWKKYNPENEYAKLLPDFEQTGARQMRWWKRSDLWKLMEFKNTIPHGRYGILGDVTQRRYKYKEEVENGKKDD